MKANPQTILTLIALGTCTLLAAHPFATQAHAQAGNQAGKQPGIEVITPVFHQLVAYTLPPGFQVDPPEHANTKNYLRETVLKGETPERWTQMITLTGHQGLATASAQRMIDTMTGKIKSSCPQTFALKNIGPMQISGAPAYLALISCGRVADQGGTPGVFHSETAMLVAIQGSEDMYTVQWAERARSSESPLPFDDAKWQSRLAALRPIRVCARVEGEQAPYPSCIGK